MDISKKNLIYKALALTFCVMFFSILISQIFYERKMMRFEIEMTYLRDTLKEGQVILSLRQTLNTKQGKPNDFFTEGLADRLFRTGIDIERLSNSEDSNTFFSKVSREWIYLNIELWQKLIEHNRHSVNKKSYIIYIYSADCNECVPYRNLINKLNKKYGDDLWLFILPDDKESGVLQVLKQYYKVGDKGMAVIVNGKLVDGDEPLKEIEEILETHMNPAASKKGKTNTQPQSPKKQIRQ